MLYLIIIIIMGSLCVACQGEKESEISVANNIYVPESIKPRPFPDQSESSDSEVDSVPMLLLPSLESSSRFSPKPISRDEFDKWNLPTNDNTPPFKEKFLTIPSYCN